VRKIETYGHVTDSGILKISYRIKFDTAVKMFAGQRIKLTVERLYKKRTTSGLNENGDFSRLQNGYYFSVVVNEYRNGAWETQQRVLGLNQAHEELKANCNYEDRYNETSGEVMRLVKSTADLTTIEFEEYLTRCREFMLEWYGITVPLPNEQTEMKLTYINENT
jgi:hypothetical protein